MVATSMSARELMEEGVARVASNSADFLAVVRVEARRIAKTKGRVTADDLRRWAHDNGIEPHHPNAWGAVFKEPGWKCVGFHTSAWPSTRSRLTRIWTRKEADHA